MPDGSGSESRSGHSTSSPNNTVIAFPHKMMQNGTTYGGSRPVGEHGHQNPAPQHIQHSSSASSIPPGQPGCHISRSSSASNVPYNNPSCRVQQGPLAPGHHVSSTPHNPVHSNESFSHQSSVEKMPQLYNQPNFNNGIPHPSFSYTNPPSSVPTNKVPVNSSHYNTQPYYNSNSNHASVNSDPRYSKYPSDIAVNGYPSGGGHLYPPYPNNGMASASGQNYPITANNNRTQILDVITIGESSLV